MSTTSPLQLVRAEIPHYYQDLTGFFWFEEAYRRLLDTLPRDRPSDFVEIGSYKGKSMAFLGIEVLRRQLQTTLHTVDPWVTVDGQQGPEIHDEYVRNIHPIRHWVRVWPMPSVEAATHFEDESLDVVFVDGDHSYEACRADILAWFPKLRRGGFMGGDDFMMKPVCDAVVEQFAPRYILVHGYCTIPQPTVWPSWIARKE